MSKIIDFYREESGNNNGHRLSEILSWSDGALEMDHDYIQWLFPSNEPSNFNADAPVLTQEDAAIFKADPELRAKVKESFLRILKFFEFELTPENKVVPLQETPVWLRAFNHNMLRATRVIKSLRLLGLELYALAFFSAIEKYRPNLSENTLKYWCAAAFDPLWEESCPK
jgi:hypothetical protein